MKALQRQRSKHWRGIAGTWQVRYFPWLSLQQQGAHWWQACTCQCNLGAQASWSYHARPPAVLWHWLWQAKVPHPLANHQLGRPRQYRLLVWDAPAAHWFSISVSGCERMGYQCCVQKRWCQCPCNECGQWPCRAWCQAHIRLRRSGQEGAAPAECAADSWTWLQPTAKPSLLQTQANPWIGGLLLGGRWGEV